MILVHALSNPTTRNKTITPLWLRFAYIEAEQLFYRVYGNIIIWSKISTWVNLQ